MTPQECGGQIVEDSDTNEVVCKECGLVVSDGNETGSSTDTDLGKI
jgi:transcription initiation factor TFIIIB Brf1 subunit/transcription initiation factor TFIIB